MVTYLSGGRIQGSSVGAKTPTYEADLSTSGGWTAATTKLTYSGSGTSSKVNFLVNANSINEVVYKQLSSASNDSLWTLRFKMVFTTIANVVSNANECQLSVGIWDGIGISGEVPSGLDGLVFNLRNISSAITTQLASYESGSWQQTNGTVLSTSVTTYYVELKRTTATAGTIKVYSDSSYSTQIGSTITDSGISSNTGLEYLAVRIYTQTVGSTTIFQGTIEDVDFWDNSSTTQDEKTTISDVPVGARYEETDTRKIFRYGTNLVDGAGLKAYYRFTEASGNIDNVADEVTDNDTVGGVLTVNNGGDADHIDYQESTATDNIPSVARWARTSAQDGAYADASGASSLWNFLHYNSSNTSNQPNCTVCWWYNTGTIENNTEFFTTTRGETGVGNRGLRIYQSNWSGGGVSWRIWVSRSGGTLYLLEASVGDIASDDEWHFYSLTYDGSTMTLKRDITDYTRTTSVSGAPASGDAYAPLSFQHVNEGSETYIPPANNTAELSIWDRVLTDAELIKIYNSGAGMNLITGVDVWQEKGVA